jgi:hypothetical protein
MKETNSQSGTTPGFPEKMAFSPLETCKLLGISIPSLWRLEKRGLIKASRALRTPRFSLKEIERFLKETTA